MKRFTTNDEIEDLCEAMIKDFFKSKHYTNVMCVDIEAFVQEYRRTLDKLRLKLLESGLVHTVTLKQTECRKRNKK